MQVLGNIWDLRYGNTLPVNSCLAYLSFVVKGITRFNWQLLQVKEWCLATWWSVKICGGFHYFDCNTLARGTSLKAFLFGQFFLCRTAAKFTFWGIPETCEWFTNCFASHPFHAFIHPASAECGSISLLCCVSVTSKYWMESLFFFTLRFSSTFFELCNISQGLGGEFI